MESNLYGGHLPPECNVEFLTKFYKWDKEICFPVYVQTGGDKGDVEIHIPVIEFLFYCYQADILKEYLMLVGWRNPAVILVEKNTATLSLEKFFKEHVTAGLIIEYLFKEGTDEYELLKNI